MSENNLHVIGEVGEARVAPDPDAWRRYNIPLGWLVDQLRGYREHLGGGSFPADHAPYAPLADHLEREAKK